MKKIIAVLSLAALCAGCSNSRSNSDENAKIDALSKKIDLLEHNQAVAVTNEFLLYTEIQTIGAAVSNLQQNVTALPDLAAIDGMAHFYHTNEMRQLDEISDWDYTAATNQLAVTKGEAALVLEAMGALNSDSSDVSSQARLARMQSDIEQIQQDVSDIKIRLGINN